MAPPFPVSSGRASAYATTRSGNRAVIAWSIFPRDGDPYGRISLALVGGAP